MKSNPPRLGRYELLERVGLGGMAEVYKARLPSVHGLYKTVAIKRILPYHCSDPSFVSMFLDEAKIALSLNHPNIGQIYELCEADDFMFLAMEYIDGPNLSTVVKRLRRTRHRFPLPLSLYVLQQVCAGLYAAHQQRDDSGAPMQIIHRDVSPHNVMVSQGGGVKLIDFGIAKAKDRLVQTEAGTVRGKLLYMSPEHAASRAIDHRADIFSVGMTLLTLLHGQHIWRGLDEVEVLLEIRKWQPPDMASLRPDLDTPVREALQTIVDRAMAFQAEDRYEDAEQMRAEISALQSRLNPTLSGVALGDFVSQILDGVLDDAEQATFVGGNDSLHILDESSEPTHQSKTPSKVSNPSTTAHVGEIALADTAMLNRQAVEAIMEHTEVSQLPGDTPATSRVHTPAQARRLDLDKVAEPATRRHGPPPEAMPAPEDRTPIEGIQVPTGGASDGVNMPDDPVNGPLSPEDATGSFQPPPPTHVGLAPRPLQPMLERPRKLLTSPLLWIGATISLLFVVLLALLAARLVFDGSDEKAAPAIPAEALGTVVVQSNPSGARIFLDGEPMGMNTPSRLEISPGDHGLHLELPNHKNYAQPFTLQPSQELTFSVEMIPLETLALAEEAPEKDAGTLLVEDLDKSPTLILFSDPPATVFIDGDQLSEPAPDNEPGMEITPLEQGRAYLIRLQKRGYETWEEEVLIDRQRVVRRVALKRKTHGRLTVTSNLWAEVYVDGRMVKKSTPLTYFKVTVGKHRVMLKNPERQLTRTVNIDIKPGELRKISVRF